jgi:SAM-dependent methyltransferase
MTSGSRDPSIDESSAAGRLYDEIGHHYAGLRQTEPRIAKHIWAALGDARTVINVGAGSGSYEPTDRHVLAAEPSAVMRAQRPACAPRCIAARAEALPFPDRSFDAAMAVLSDHHWSDPIAGLREMQRVAKRVVLLQWDNQLVERFWLVRDYLPEFAAVAEERPSLRERAALIGAEMQPVPIPWDCVDGFFYAFWRRPEMYLDERIRRATSVWSRVGSRVERRVVRELRRDLECGRWQERNRELLHLNEAELGARLLIAEH